METSGLKQQVETLEPEICRMRAELLHAQQEIERLKAVVEPQSTADSGTTDAILVFISERHNPSLRRIASRFGVSQEEARSTLGELQRSGLVSPLNLLNGVQRWIIVKKGMQYLEERRLLNQTFRQRAPSRVYW
jgi:predicted HTH transcriptional regulator